MIFQGRHINPIALWGQYVEFPPNMDVDQDDEFLPLVKCPNPDHHTEKRHFQINIHKPLVHCFANCGISGTYEHAIGLIEGVRPRESRRIILKHSRIGKGVNVKKRSASKRNTEIDLSYDRYLPPLALEYLESRNISPATVAQWELGWDADERRIVIPVKDSRGRVRMLIRRAVREKDHPKYLYTEGVDDRKTLLMGACQIDPSMITSMGVILVEGSFDLLVMRQHGFHNTFATLGSSLSQFQAKQILNMRPRRVVTMFDPDAAGIAATLSVVRRVKRIPVRVCRYPKGVGDPAQTTREQAERMVRRAITSSEFQRIVKSVTPNTRSKADRRKEISFG